MKVIKIDIQKEVLDMQPRPSYDFVKTPKLSIYCDENVLFQSPDIEKLTYYVHKVRFPVSGQEVNYIVQHDDLGIVKDLFRISEDNLKEKINKEIQEAIKDIMRSVKRLSWWKRLFNLF